MCYIYYAYPIVNRVSFTLVAETHIQALKLFCKVRPLEIKYVHYISPVTKPILFLHPFFYTVWESPHVSRILFKHKRNLYKLIFAVDVADSTKIAPEMADKASEADAVITNSRWSYNSFLSSGITAPIYVIPHAINDKFFTKSRNPTWRVTRELYKKKLETRRLEYILFFLWHSGYRKGADLAAQIIKRLLERGRKIVAIIKTNRIKDPYLKYFRGLPAIIIDRWLPVDYLIELYDVSDLVLVPSRGGSVELNAVEALARGRPILAPNGGPFPEYVRGPLASYYLVKVARWVRPLPDNRIHVGLGPELDVNDAVDKAEFILDNKEALAGKAQELREYIKKSFSFEALVNAFTRFCLEVCGVSTWGYQRTTTLHQGS